MSYDDDERSVDQNRPIELYTIQTPNVTYYLTSYTLPVPFGGFIFTPLTMDRSTNQLTNDPGTDEMTVTLPIDHPLVQSYASTGLPELVITVTVQRLQTRSGAAQQIFKGYAQSMSADEHTAKIRVPALTADALKIQLPVVGATRLCNHRLFDDRCSPHPRSPPKWPVTSTIVGSGGPDRDSFQIIDTAISVSADGLTLGLFAIGVKPNGWATFGRLINPATQEQRRILSHIGTTITLAVPFVGFTAGTGVQVEAGCDHSFTTCVAKFNNALNHGGHPLMTTFNPWQSSGLGIIQQA